MAGELWKVEVPRFGSGEVSFGPREVSFGPVSSKQSSGRDVGFVRGTSRCTLHLPASYALTFIRTRQ